MSWTTGTLLRGALSDWDDVKLGAVMVEFALVSARGKHTMQCKQLNTLPLEVTTTHMVRWALTAVLTIHMSIVYSRIGVTE